jgi:hypothetical protein
LRRDFAGFRNIGALARFVTSDEQKDGLGAASAEVYSIAWTIVDAELTDSASERLRIAKIPNGKATYSGEDTTDRTLISKR